MLGLHCNMQDLVPWRGIKPGSPALGAWSLSHWTTKAVPGKPIFPNDLVDFVIVARGGGSPHHIVGTWSPLCFVFLVIWSLFLLPLAMFWVLLKDMENSYSDLTFYSDITAVFCRDLRSGTNPSVSHLCAQGGLAWIPKTSETLHQRHTS